MGCKDLVKKMADELKPLSQRQIEWCKAQHMKRVVADKNKNQGTRQYMFTQFMVNGDWQILRNWICYVSVRNRGKEINVSGFGECGRIFYNVKSRKRFFMSRKLRCMGRGIDFAQPMIFRKDDSWLSSYWLFANEGMPIIDSRLHQIVRRNGLSVKMLVKAWEDRGVRTWGTVLVMDRILSEPYYETIIKSEYWKLVADEVEVRGLGLKPMMKMVSNGIRLMGQELGEWRDAVGMMDRENIDWRNGKILKDWRRWHEVALRKIEKKKVEGKLLMIGGLEEAFAKIHGEHMGKEWCDGMMKFHVLSSVKEYYEEGKAMHHCVYANKYYTIKDVVIISVRLEGVREATVEYNLKKRKVVQIQSYCNQHSKVHDEILESVMNNIEKVLAA